MKNQKGIIQIVLTVAVVAVLTFVGYLLYVQRQKTEVAEGPNVEMTANIKDTSDLSGAADSLDSFNTTELDTHLNALDSASKGF